MAQQSALDNLLGRVKQIFTPAAQGVSSAFQAAGQALNKQQPISPIKMAPQNADTGYGFIGNIQRGLQQAELARISAFRDTPNIADRIIQTPVNVPRLQVRPSATNPISGFQMATNAAWNYLGAPVLENAIKVPKNIVGYGMKVASGTPYRNQDVLGDVMAPSVKLLVDSKGLQQMSPAVKGLSNVVENAGKKTLLKAFTRGAVETAPYGSGYGFSEGLVKHQNDKNAVDQVLNSMGDAAIGGVLSGLVGGGIASGSYLFGKLINHFAGKIKAYKPNASEAELKADSKGFLHDTAGRWAGRQKKVPVYYNDLWEEAGLNRADGRPNVGLSIQEVTPKERARLKVKPNLTQQVAESVPGVEGKKLKVKPAPVEAPIPETFPIKPGETNVNTLNLTDAQKADVYARQGHDIVTPLTDVEVKKLAESMGMNPKTYSREEIGIAKAKALNTKGHLQEVEKKIETAIKNGASEQELIDLNKEFVNANNAYRTQGTMASHQMSVRKILGNDFQTPRQKVFTLLDKAGVNPVKYTQAAAKVDFKDPNQVVDFYRSFVPRKLGDWLDVVRYNSMLSSPVTHLVNITSNTAGTGIIKPILKTVEGGVDALASAFNPSRKRTRFAGEGLELAKGYYNKESFKSAYGKLMDVMTGRSEIKNPDYKRIRLYGSGKGKVIEDILLTTGKALEGMDQFFTELSTKGLERSNKLRVSKGGKVLTSAADEATKDLFRGDLVNKGEGVVSNFLGGAGNWVASGGNSKVPAVRWFAKMMIPFLKVGTNLAKEGLAYNPVTGAANLIKNEDKINQLAKMAVGGTVMATAIPLALNDSITFGPPSSTKEKDARKAAGIPDYGIKFGNTWVKYDKFHPALSFQLAMVGALTDAVKRGKITDNVGVKIAKGVMNWMRFGLDQTYYKNVSDMMGAVDNADLASGLSNVASNWVSQVIPFRAGLTWLNNVIDQTQRKADVDAGFIDKSLQNIAAQLPLASFFTPERVNAQGQPVKKPSPYINLFSPWKISQEDPNAAAYLKLLETQNQNNKDLNDIQTAIKYNLRTNEKKDTTGLSELGINPNFLETQKQTAEDQIYKQNFEMSGAKWAENNGKIYMNDEGTVRVIDKQDFEKSVKDAVFKISSDRLLRSEDFNGWLQSTNEYINFLQEYQKTLDPTFDQVKIIEIENTIEDLAYKASKYVNQGGFKKGKKLSVKMPALKIVRPKFARSKTKTKKSKLKVQQPKIAKAPVIKVNRVKRTA